VAYVLHFVPVFCPPKKAEKRTGFSKKEKPYSSHLTRAKWQEKPQFSSTQFLQNKYPPFEGAWGRNTKILKN
jgi:hypothetical protein